MISVLTVQQLSLLVELDKQCFSVPWSREQIKEEFSQPFAIVLGYFDGEKLVGAILARVVIDEIWIFRIMVHPQFRRKGIAHQLLNKITAPFEEGANTGAAAVWLEVEKSNADAIQFYESEGFSLISTRPDYYPASDSRPLAQDALIMRRELRA